MKRLVSFGFALMLALGLQGTARAYNYMVIDLSGGWTAGSYPVSYMDEPPPGGWVEGHKTTNLVMRRIPAGTYVMGSPIGECGRAPDETQHQVTLTDDFFIGVFEVTQKQWSLVMNKWPSFFTNAAYRDSRPVDTVCYYQVRENPALAPVFPHWPDSAHVHSNSFMGKLRAKTRLDKMDLPTEAQWEYACRAETATSLNSGHNNTNIHADTLLDPLARYHYNAIPYTQNSDPTVGTATVGSYLPNRWGLYDMHGNVQEWCLDWYGEYAGAGTNPAGPASGQHRVMRGGSFGGATWTCRSAMRQWSGADNVLNNSLGFRLARNLEPGEYVSRPAFGPDGGMHLGAGLSVTISCATAGAVIRYTTDGSDPSESSPTVESGNSVYVPLPGTLKSRAWKTGVLSSAVRSAGYERQVSQPFNDYDGDRVSEAAVFDAFSGKWYAYNLNNATATVWGMTWGGAGVQPAPGDYDGDAYSDLAIFDGNNGRWYVWSLRQSGTPVWGKEWGWPGAITVPGDYDGDGKSDFAVFDQNTGKWYVLAADQSTVLAWDLAWGWPGAITVPGDYDCDGKDDICVYDSNTGFWYARTLGGAVLAWGLAWGWPGAITVPGDYDADGSADMAVYNQSGGTWYVWSRALGKVIIWAHAWGWPGALPAPGDYDGDFAADLAVYDQNTGNWYIWSQAKSEVLAWQLPWGWPGAYPPGVRQ
ncbi:MAG: SUMF1/EgtB/PvdO family nonheme iron enzyme [Lentisphaerae bacterium]|nr:SUMF1/EgtB/PvdO family nonheme iron enzyme [Lentisphaerota bacterium]